MVSFGPDSITLPLVDASAPLFDPLVETLDSSANSLALTFDVDPDPVKILVCDEVVELLDTLSLLLERGFPPVLQPLVLVGVATVYRRVIAVTLGTTLSLGGWHQILLVDDVTDAVE